MANTPRSRQQEVYERLRSDILSGELKPGQRLRFNDICQSYDVSVGVIREALSRLAEQRLVTVTHQSGYAVMELSRRDLEALTSARRLIEGVALAEAIAKGDVDWESEVLAVHHRLASLPHAENTDEWGEVHREFHETLLRGCDNPYLISVAAELRDAAEVYRRWSLVFDTKHTRDIPAEHKEIVDAVLAGDAPLAGTLLDTHIALTTERLIEAEVLHDGEPGDAVVDAKTSGDKQ